MNISELRRQRPELANLDDETVVRAVQLDYPDVPLERIASDLGVKIAAPPAPPRTLGGTAKDIGVSALQGAVSVPEAAVGLADMVTGGAVGKGLEGIGFRPKEAKAILSDAYSDPQKAAFKAVQDANGVVDTFGAAVTHPSTVFHSVIESLPLMGAGGVIGRAVSAIAPISAGAAAAVGEGVTMAGSDAEQIRQNDPNGNLSAQQAGIAGAIGVAGGGLALLGAKVAKSMGIHDIDTMIVAGQANPIAGKGLTRKLLEGAFTEGVLEELPQSIMEQVLQNKAMGKPLDEGVDQAAVMGLLAGAAMGAGAQLMGGNPKPHAIVDEQPAPGAVSPAAGPIESAVAQAAPTAAMNTPAPPDAMSKAIERLVKEAKDSQPDPKEETARALRLAEQMTRPAPEEDPQALRDEQIYNEATAGLPIKKEDVPATPEEKAKADAIDAAAHEAATSPLNDLAQPTDAQKEAGNYKKGHINWNGLDATIENPQGSTRTGKRPDGSEWSHEMTNHYGYFKRTVGADEEQVDAYFGPRPDAPSVFIIDQVNQGDKSFDEHKVMAGFASRAGAVNAYKRNFDKGWVMGRLTEMPIEQFKEWLKNGDTTKPASPHGPLEAKGPTNETQASAPASGAPAASPVANDVANAAPGGGVRGDVAQEGGAAPAPSAPTQGAAVEPAAGSSVQRVETALPTGWTESRPGGMATSADPVRGGIVDTNAASGKWFAVPSMVGIGALENFNSRADALAALERAVAAKQAPDKKTLQQRRAEGKAKKAEPQEKFYASIAAAEEALKAAGRDTHHIVRDRRGLAVRPKAAQESEQYKSYREWIDAHPGPIPAGMRETIQMDERLSDGEAEKLLGGSPVDVQKTIEQAVSVDHLSKDELAQVAAIFDKPKPPAKPKASANTIVTDEAAAAARAIIKKKLGVQSAATPAMAAIENALMDLPKADQAKLANHYGPGLSRAESLERVRDDVVAFINKGAHAVASTIRSIIKTIAEGVLSVAIVFNPMGLKSDLGLNLPQVYKQTVTQTRQVKAEPPLQAIAAMSPAAIEVYEAMAPVASSQGKGFIIADKPAGMLHAFHPDGSLLVQDAALFGKDKGDTEAADKRVTPAGRFKLKAVDDPEYTGGKVLWLEETYRANQGVIAVHSVWLGDPKEGRAARLASPKADDHRISYGCVNTTEDAFLNKIIPNIDAFNGGMALVVPDDGEIERRFPATTEEVTSTTTTVAGNAKGSPINRQQEGMGDRTRTATRSGSAPRGLDPELLQAGITMTLYHLGRGATSFNAYSKAMIEDMGEAIAPYLKSWYMAAKYDPRAASLDGMDDEATVNAAKEPTPTPAPAPAPAPAQDAHVTKWFGTQEKADAYIAKKGIADTHQVVKATPYRFEIHSKTAGANVAEPESKQTPDAIQTDTAPGAGSMVDHLAGEIAAGRMPKDNPALKRMVEAFDGVEPGPARMKRAQEELEAAIVMRARAIAVGSATDAEKFNRLRAMYESQPLLNVRTSTSIENQAYSTPAPLAFIASRLAQIGKADTVLEPTAGTGMLLMQANKQKADVNELNPDRAELLRAQGFRVSEHDASIAIRRHAGYPVDVVIANPPFGSIKDGTGGTTKVLVDGYRFGQIDHLIAARALSTMKDDGKAVLILGANKVAGGMSTDDRIFMNWLYGNYRVRTHFEVDGKLYTRQGASWPVRVIAIDGRQKSDAVAPREGTIERVDTWEKVYERYENHLATERGTVGSPMPGPVGGSDEQTRAGQPVPRPAGAEAPSDGGRGPGGRAARPANVAGASPGTVGDRGAIQPDRMGPAPLEQRGDDETDEPVGPFQAGPDRATPARRPADAGRNSGTDRLASEDNQFQVGYVARSSRKDEGVLIPVNMAQPLQEALDVLEDAVGDIDQFAAKELGYASVPEMQEHLMGLQIDSVASAIHQVKRGKAIIIADQTGIGKGRQAAAIIRWSVKNGKIPVFVTVKPSLFTDMYGDLADIGTSDVAPYILNWDEYIKGPGDEKLFHTKTADRRSGLAALNAGEMPEGRNAIFMTYSQINTPNAQRAAISSIAHRAVFILDESHNAGGESGTGDFIKSVLEQASGTVYLSATYAKRPDNMPLYFKTDMGEAVADDDTLMAAMESGGLPLQTVVSNNLVKAGQMFRRERSYDGVEIKTVVDTAHRAEHEALSDKATSALRAIVKADGFFHNVYVKARQKEMERSGGTTKDNAGNQAKAGVDHTQFTSVVHNFVRQMLLGLKAQAAADSAIAKLKAGEKPLIALENTMGSFLTNYAADNGLQVGEPLGDFSYRTVLSRALDRTRYLNIVNAQGVTSKEYVPLEKLDPVTRAAYDSAQAVIDSLEIDIPVSPIDWMRQQIINAGYTVAEITGRNYSVDYSDPKNPKLSKVDQLEQDDKVRTTRAFNAGGLDMVVLNVSGSTGISLHASEKFKDQRPRRMIVAQAAQDINILMQMLGRIHRTGQVELPGYEMLTVDLPAERRPAALTAKKMKSLNANTSSNTESATSIEAVDMLNKYGDQVVAQYLHDNIHLAQAMGLPTPMDSEGNPSEVDIARKATGRLALMPVATQKLFYEEIEAQYNTLIDYLNKTNQNDLEPRTFDFDAKELKSELIFEGTNPASPFGSDAVYGEYSVKALGKPMTPDEIKAEIDSHLDGKSGGQHATALLGALDAGFDEYLKTVPDDAKTAVQEARARTLTFIHNHAIGSYFRVDINGDTYNAVVTNIKSTHKKNGNPYAMSKIQVTVALNGALRHVTVPATRFESIEVSRLGSGYSLRQLFEVKAESREVAKIITGNLLGAYGELQGVRGTIISFTKEDGTSDLGILLPKTFTMAENARGGYRLRTGEQVVRFLHDSHAKNISQLGVASRDGVVRIVPAADRGVTIRVPKSKARGGKFFLNQDIRAVTGDFTSTGDSMGVTVPASKAAAAIEAVMKKQAIYALPSMANDAKAMFANDKPVFSQSKPTDLEALQKFWSNRTWDSEGEARAMIKRRIAEDNERYPMFKPQSTALADQLEFTRAAGAKVKVKMRRERAETPNPLGQSEPDGSHPDVDWTRKDMQGDRDESSVMAQYGRGRGRVYRAWIDVSTLPEAKGEDITHGVLDETSGPRAELSHRGEPPPIKVRVGARGRIDLLDGNHRLAYWRERGYEMVPAYVIDERAEPPAFRQGGAESSPAQVGRLQQVADAITGKWGRKVEAVVVPSVASRAVPQEVRDEAKALISKGGNIPSGVLYQGRVYLFADRITNDRQAAQILIHEAKGHIGLRGNFGAELDGVLRQIVQARPSEVAQMIAKNGFKPEERMRAAEEVLAEMAEKEPTLGFVTRAIAALRTWLRNNVPSIFGRTALTDDEIVRTFLEPAARYIETGKKQPAPGAGPMFSSGQRPFFSALQKGIEAIPDKSLQAIGWIGAINSLTNKGKAKAEEVEWTGIKEWLATQEGRIPKEAVLTFLAENGVQVSEVHKGRAAEGSRTDVLVVELTALGWDINYNQAEDETTLSRRSNGERYVYDSGWDAFLPEGATPDSDDLDGKVLQPEAMGEAGRLIQEYMALVDGDPYADRDDGDGGTATRYERYTLPGGQNYREVLLTLPAMPGQAPIDAGRKAIYEAWQPRIDAAMRRLDAAAGGDRAEHDAAWADFQRLQDERATEADRIAGLPAGDRGKFRSNHWDEPNILAHIRLNDRTDADGKRVLFVEEIQSDWAQQGKKKGFVSQRGAPLTPEEHKRAMDLQRMDSVGDSMTQAERDEWQELRARHGRSLPGMLVPDAPFVGKTDAWVSLALKRIIKMAVDEGYDKVAFVNGEQSADRYDLSKQVSSIEYSKNPSDGTFDVLVRGLDGRGAVWSKKRATAQEVEDTIGKDMLKKMDAGEGKRSVSFGGVYEHSLAGDGLKVGGEGMRAFYDKIVPAAANKLLAKMGGNKIEEVRIPKTEAKVKDIDYKALRADLMEIARTDMGQSEFFDEWEDLRGIITEADLEDIGNRDPHNQYRNGPAVTALVAKVRQSAAAGKAMKQTGFEITPAMRAAAGDGLPLFAQAKGFNTRKIQVGGVWRPIDNSKGQLIGADFAKQQNFWKWAGDTKVVDEQGRPLVVYHGSNEDLAEFKSRHPSDGIYFSSNAQYAGNYADVKSEVFGGNATAYPVYLALRNPLELSGEDEKQWQRYTERGFDVRELAKQGYDGVTMRYADGEVEAMAFEPTQIKSATGNNGNFDASNPDIRFSQSAGINDVRDYWPQAMEIVNEFRDTPGKLNWWQKTFGTPFDLAQRQPMFKAVYDRVQEFLRDVSLYATEAADKAPSIIPKLESWRDLLPKAAGGSGKKPLSPEDNKVVGRPVWEGTLVWSRDAKGRPVKMESLEAEAEALDAHEKGQRLFKAGHISESVLKMWKGLPIEQFEATVETSYEKNMLQPGIVWTDDELKTMFGLDARQIGLYREFHASIAQSIHDMAKSDMLRFAGKDAQGWVRQQVLNAPDAVKASEVLRDHLMELAELEPERNAVLLDTANRVVDKGNRAKALLDRGYAPLSRFGKYAVDVVSPDGERLYFGLFEGRMEANRKAAQMRDEFPGARVTRGTTSQEEYKMFQNMSPETAELFGEMLGLEADGTGAANIAFQKWLKEARAGRSALKRLIERKGIAGYSEDMGRVLAGFVYSNSRQTATNLHASDIKDRIQDIPQGQGELKDAAIRLMRYVQDPQEEAQGLRGVLFAQYLGGSVAAMLVNMTQPFQVTMPYLSQFGGVRKSASTMKSALADVWKDATGDAGLDAALKRAAEQGIVAPQEVHQLMAQAGGKGALRAGDGTMMGNAGAVANNALARLMLAWGKPFAMAELFNRRVTFIAAYRTAVREGMSDPAKFAADAVDATQFVYNKGNKPEWARGAVGSILFTFKQYSISYLELAHRMYTTGGPEGKKAALFMLAMLMLMGGAGGLPFVEDVSDLVDGAAQRMGYNLRLRHMREKLLRDTFGEAMGGFLDKGVSGLPGVPIDVAGRFGMGNLIPGTGLLTQKADHTRDVTELAGPAGDFAARAFQGANEALSGDLVKAGLTVGPKAAFNLAKAGEMASLGFYTDSRGRKVVDTDAYDVFAKAIGFQPNAVAKVQQATSDVQQMVAVARLKESEIADRWAMAVFKHDSAAAQSAKDEVSTWNEKNPDSPIKISYSQITRRVREMNKPKEQRVADAAPKEVRQEVRRQLAEGRK